MAFDSISSISLSKPSVSFIVNDWVLNVTLPKPTINTDWLLNVTLPSISIEAYVSPNFVLNSTLPTITISSSYAPNDLYVLNSILKTPNTVFSVSIPNVYSLAQNVLKPTAISYLSSNITGSLDSKLPLINVVFNAVLTATTIKQTWAFNTITTAHSRYTNYDFNSFFKLGSKNYGINANGDIYELVGHKDFVGEATEANIDAEVIFPSTTYDVQNLKSCSDAFIYGRGDGDIEIQVVLDEQQARTGYTAHFDNKEGMHRRRVKIPKGLQGNVWQFIMKNVDGSWFDINMFEVFVRSLQRIIKGN